MTESWPWDALCFCFLAFVASRTAYLYSGIVTTKPGLCRFHAFASPMVHALHYLLPDNTCIEGVPGEIDLHLTLEDLEKLPPSQLNSVTWWLEKQVADVSKLAVSPVNCLRHLCLDYANA